MVIDAVVDSSVIVALVTLEKYSDWASKTLQEHGYFHILDLSFYEVANALKQKAHKGLDPKDAVLSFEQAKKMMNLYAVHSFSEVFEDLLNKASKLEITVYDAAFLLLAVKLDMPLITLDIRLTKKLETTKYNSLIECPKH